VGEVAEAQPAADVEFTADETNQPSVTSARSRMISSHRPAPPEDRLIGIWAWGVALGVVGLVAALRGLPAITAGTGPSWYEPTLAGVGLGGVGLTLAAFLSARYARLPWIMLGLATVPMVVTVALTVSAL